MLQITDLAPFSSSILLLFAIGALGIFSILKKPKHLLLATLLSILASAGFAFLINDRGLPWWGLMGDEAFIGAAITKAWNGLYWSDFYYTSLPPFYPPLYYWVTGFVGKLIGLSPLGAMNAGVATSLLLLPISIYGGIRSLPSSTLWKRSVTTGPKDNGQLFAFIAAGFVLMVSSWVGMLSKPFEFLTAALVIIWVLHIVALTQESKPQNKKIILLGILGALIVWTYYFWMIFAGLALLTLGIWYAKSNRKKWYTVILKTIGITALFSSPFWITLLQNTFAGNTEAWQAVWFSLHDLSPFLSLLHGTPALVALAGIISLIAFRKHLLCKTLAAVAAAPVLWYIMNLLLLIFFNISILPTKALHFITSYALAFAAAYGLSIWLTQKTHYQKLVLAPLWIIFILAVPSGTFAFEYGHKHILNLKQPHHITEVVNHLKKIPNISSMPALVSEQPQIVGQVPISTFLSFNMHFTHPAARWTERYLVLHELSTAQTPEEFFTTSQNNPFDQIELLVLRKHKDEYHLYLWRDNFPDAGYPETIIIPEKLVSSKHWETLFKSKEYKILKKR